MALARAEQSQKKWLSGFSILLVISAMWIVRNAEYGGIVPYRLMLRTNRRNPVRICGCLVQKFSQSGSCYRRVQSNSTWSRWGTFVMWIWRLLDSAGRFQPSKTSAKHWLRLLQIVKSEAPLGQFVGSPILLYFPVTGDQRECDFERAAQFVQRVLSLC